MHYYEADKDRVLSKINSIYQTISNKLLPVYNNIESEAKEIEKNTLEELSRNFNPDTMDPSDAYQEAWENGAEHYILQHEMKKEFLLSTATWLFYLFEKDCKTMCPLLHNKPIELKSKFIEMGISCGDDSDWYITNTELRLVANTIKHGDGRSSESLKIIRPDFFENESSILSDGKIKLSFEDIQNYVNSMTRFWESFFEKVLPTY